MYLAGPLGHRDGSDHEAMYSANYELMLAYALRRTHVGVVVGSVVGGVVVGGTGLTGEGRAGRCCCFRSPLAAARPAQQATRHSTPTTVPSTMNSGRLSFFAPGLPYTAMAAPYGWPNRCVSGERAGDLGRSVRRLREVPSHPSIA